MKEIKEIITYILMLVIALILLHLGLVACELPKIQDYYTKQAYAQEAVRVAHLLVK